jgi:hypothetical protein
MQSTINSYPGLLQHANHYRLRKILDHQQLGPLQQFFITTPFYRSIRIRKHIQARFEQVVIEKARQGVLP